MRYFVAIPERGIFASGKAYVLMYCGAFRSNMGTAVA